MSLLSAESMQAGYGKVRILHHLDLHVNPGEVVVILGANGAGKTTTLKALCGLIPTEGRVEVLGDCGDAPLHARARRGLSFLPDERGIIRELTVEENLRLGRADPDVAYTVSPELLNCRNRLAGDLSGGEQQILAITRCLVHQPKLLLADELSLGLAPIIVSRMFDLLRRIAETGAGVLMVEQYARQALAVADRAYVLERGRVVLQGTAAEIVADIDGVERSYLGTGGVT
jgi:branched-chain amino acid transport system ATP-binding protein